MQALGEKIAMVALANSLAENDQILHAPQTLEIIAEEMKVINRKPSIILANENAWWRKK